MSRLILFPELMFSQSGDISSVYLCGACKAPVTWNDKGIMCESCESCFHIQCLNVHDTANEQLGQSSVAWICRLCDGPSYSSVLFDLHSSESSQPSGMDDSTLSLGSLDYQELLNPKYASSSPIRPKLQPAGCLRPRRIINVHCQSLIHKKPAFFNLIDSTKPDIIIITESWFNSEICDAKYFNTEHYTVHRRDRGGKTPGGVLLFVVAVNSDFLSMRDI